MKDDEEDSSFSFEATEEEQLFTKREKKKEKIREDSNDNKGSEKEEKKKEEPLLHESVYGDYIELKMNIKSNYSSLLFNTFDFLMPEKPKLKSVDEFLDDFEEQNEELPLKPRMLTQEELNPPNEKDLLMVNFSSFPSA